MTVSTPIVKKLNLVFDCALTESLEQLVKLEPRLSLFILVAKKSCAGRCGPLLCFFHKGELV